MEHPTSNLFSLKIRVTMFGVSKFQPRGGAESRTFEYKFKVYRNIYSFVCVSGGQIIIICMVGEISSNSVFVILLFVFHLDKMQLMQHYQ